MITSSLLQNKKGNAILISLGMVSFLFVAISGASKVIDASLQQSPRILQSGKAAYSAEGALESAFYEASGRSSGYTMLENQDPEPGDPGFISTKSINNTTAQWTTSSRQALARTRNEGNMNDYTLFIPPRVELPDRELSTPEERITALKKNWKKVRFGKPYTFHLYVDNSSRHKPLLLGGGEETSIAETNDQGLPVGENDLVASDTKSIFGDSSSGSNTNLKAIFFDLYIPGYPISVNAHKGSPGNLDSCPEITETLFENSPLLAWTLSSRTDGIGVPDVLSLKSHPDCDHGYTTENNSGVICTKHFANAPSNGIHCHRDSNNGLWVRLVNPSGIFRGNHIYPLNILDYAQGSLSGGGEVLNGVPLFFPELRVQMGKKQKWRMFSTDGVYIGNISEAYMRIGFRYQDSTLPSVFQSFPIPNDSIKITATGNANGFKRTREGQIQPKEIAPMFEYAVFQP